jgi:hypothetical protein
MHIWIWYSCNTNDGYIYSRRISIGTPPGKKFDLDFKGTVSRNMDLVSWCHKWIDLILNIDNYAIDILINRKKFNYFLFFQ